MKKNRLLLGLGLLLLIVFACKKPQVGYLSDNIFYNANPFIVKIGDTKYSSIIAANGSTFPLHVKLLKVKNEKGEDVTQTFTKPRNIAIFKDAITAKDSTLVLLKEKFKDSLVSPFQVNNIGGRLEFSNATSYLVGGDYSIDVEVSNVKGTRVIKDVCGIQLENRVAADIFKVDSKKIYVAPNEYIEFSGTDDNYITVNAEYIPGADNGSFCIYKFLDRNGKLFNPLKGEVTRTGANYPFFNDWNPWYEVKKTDTAFVQEIPNYEGKKFPYFDKTLLLDSKGDPWLASGDGDERYARYDWRIPNEYIFGLDVDLLGTAFLQINGTGTFVITIQEHKFARKKLN